MSETLHIYIGFDAVETVSWHVLTQSIIARSSIPIAFHPVKKSMLKEIYTRQTDPKQSNEFSFTRFLAPYLQDYRGWALFIDCDQMFRVDIKEIKKYMNPIEGKSVYVCHHDYEPKSSTKYLGAVQYSYPRKNWSSVMLFNCSHSDCRKLTPEYVNTAPALDLHRFNWTSDEKLGELPIEFNHLVGEYPYDKDAKNIHWTNFGPWLNDFADTDYADEWFKEKAIMNHAVQNSDVDYDPFATESLKDVS